MVLVLFFGNRTYKNISYFTILGISKKRCDKQHTARVLLRNARQRGALLAKKGQNNSHYYLIKI
jgi:hypothetical protein